MSKIIQKLLGDRVSLKSTPGFILAEVFVIGVIILGLSLMVVTGIKGFQASDRDVRRIDDLGQVERALQIYLMRWGHYPGDKDGDTRTGPVDWVAFADAFKPLGIMIPGDPTGTYYYAYSEDKLAYVLGAKFERYNKVLENEAEIDGVSSAILGSAPMGMDCTDNNLGYCVGAGLLSRDN